MKKYKVDYLTFTPVEYEVTRETDSSIWYINSSGTEKMERKTTTINRWYDTFEDAKEASLRSLNIQRKNALRKAEVLKQDYNKLESLDKAQTPKERAAMIWEGERY